MRTVKSNLIKMLTIALVVCLGVFVALIPMTKSPVNADEVSFSITGEDMNGAQKGLQFVGSLTGTPDEYGILVYPAGDTAIDDSLDVKANEEALDALNFINQKSAAICFNRDTMLTWESVTEDNVDDILAKFYAKDFTATPYFVAGGETYYGESYTSNMLTVAQAHVNAKDSTEQKLAQQILGWDVVENAEIEGSIDFAGREDGYCYPAAVYVNGTEVFNVGDETDGETTSISLAEYVTAKTTASNVLDIRFLLEGDEIDEETGYYLRKTVCYNDVTYWTSIISNVDELTEALSYTGLTSLNNYGFYKMDADITLTANLAITYYSGSVTKDGGKGFCGVFNGDGHYIDFAGFKTSTTGTAGAGKPAGLFGDFAYSFSATATGEQPLAQVTVENLAVLNFPSNSNDYVFGRYTMGHGYSVTGTPHFENIYVTYKSSGYYGGALLRYPGAVTMKNVFVDKTSNPKNSYSSHAAYNNGVSGKTFFQAQATAGNHVNNYNGGTLFQSLSSLNQTKSTFDNVISIGYTPLAWQTEHTWWDSQRGPIKSNSNGDGTYTHSVDLTKGFSADYAQFIAYAGNQTVGDVAVKLSIKEKFLNLEGVNKNPGYNLAGAYCAKCYDEFSLVTDGSAICPTCNVAMKVVTSETGKDMWAQPAIYNWGVEDLDNLVIAVGGGSVKLNGTAKYNTLAQLSDIFLNKDSSIYDSFLGEDGNGMWKINANGELTWGALVSEAYVFNEIDFDAKTGEIISTDLPSYDDITSIIANGNELTKENGGIIQTETGYKLNVLASGATETNGVPYINTVNSESNMITMKVSSTNDTVNYANVRYWTSIIYNQAGLADALALDYSVAQNRNLGFYKLANDLSIESEDGKENVNNVLGIDYTGFNQYSYAGNVATMKGFAGQFDGDGHTINFNRNYQPYGLFASFNTAWNDAAGQLQSQITVKDLAIINYKANTPVLAYYCNDANYNSKCELLLSNIYVKMHANDMCGGLIYNAGLVRTNNVVIDATGTTSDSYISNDLYGEEVKGIAQLPSYNGGTLFTKMRYGHQLLSGNKIDNITNVVSIGRAPIAWLSAYQANKWYSHVVNHTLDSETGNYVHTLKNTTGWSGAIGNNASLESYVGYAGNQEYGDIALPASIKANFLALVENYDGSAALPGAYCATCYNEFSLVTDGTVTCPTCEGNPVMTVASVDIWSSPAVYTWKVQDLRDYDNISVTNGTSGQLVFKGVNKYITKDAMKTAYEADDSIFASFEGADGNGLWDVVDGVLTWVGAAA